MLKTRVIPVLLMQDGGLVKGKQFKNHKYVGDPINAVKIFNQKEVDELVFLDISCTSAKLEPNYSMIKEIASEAFMPFSYGGGINCLKHIEKIFSLGVEKAVINSAAFYNPQLISDASIFCGSQSIVVSIDVKQTLFGGYKVYVQNGRVETGYDPVEYAKKMEDFGAGEIILCSIDKEGTANGYDIKILDEVSRAVDIPVVGLGGAGCLKDLAIVKNQTSLSGLAAGDIFIFHGKHKAILLTYPSYSELESLFK